MCGVVGIVGKFPVSERIYDAMLAMQHRGQDAAGIATSDGRQMYHRKGNGLVHDVFRQHHMEQLIGNIGIGHVRYPTAGSASADEAQPMYVNSPYGIALGHNGNLTNHHELKRHLAETDQRHLNTKSDSEVLLNVLAHELAASRTTHLTPDQVFAAVRNVHSRCRGAYAAVAMVMEQGVVAFRDPNGIRPLVYGVSDTARGREYMIASESAALDVLGFRLERDVKPGEALFIDRFGQLHHQICANETALRPCVFEHVYLANPVSIMDNVSVYKARLRMGEKLAAQILDRFPDGHDIDVVIPIPDTGRTAALPLAHDLGVKYREGFIRNRYLGRTFIMPGQTQRANSVRRKYGMIELEFQGKVVLLVDDSIVRSTTLTAIVAMAREAGARKVYVASAAPPVRFPNVYGIDMPAAHELVAAGRSEDEIARVIGADDLFYQRLEDLVACSLDGNSDIEGFDCSVFDGNYVTGDIDRQYLEQLAAARRDEAKVQQVLAFPEPAEENSH